MIPKDYRDYVQDILDSINDTEQFIKGIEYTDFVKDRKTINAVIRSMEIIGEAAKNIPDTLRKKYINVPWKKMTGMRDKLIHEYAGVDLEIVWQVIKKDLPPLKPYVEQILQDLENSK